MSARSNKQTCENVRRISVDEAFFFYNWLVPLTLHSLVRHCVSRQGVASPHSSSRAAARGDGHVHSRRVLAPLDNSAPQIVVWRRVIDVPLSSLFHFYTLKRSSEFNCVIHFFTSLRNNPLFSGHMS